MSPQIGLWWDAGRQIIAFPRPVGQPDAATGICDSDDSHNDLWPEAAMLLDAGTDDEYFSVPRGRVMWNPTERVSIIHHGNGTPAARLPEIAKEFELTKWVPRADINYTMRTAADRLFDDD